jgi:glycosyltransferase involved in cell wall biosynthesis
MNELRIIALLGRRDEPTDAVEEYCRYLGGALRDRGSAMELVRVPWAERGWTSALRELREKAHAWNGKWVLLQYTALAWSARGFPLGFLRVVKELRDSGAQVAIVYHDVEPFTDRRWIDAIRRRAQLRVMQKTLKVANLGIFTVPLDVISWLGKSHSSATFIPVGANLPVEHFVAAKSGETEQTPLRVVVFGITEGDTGRKECARIVEAVGFAAARGGAVRLHAFGRGALECESELRKGLKNVAVELRVEGVLPAEQVVEALSSSDVMLFVRAPISSRRGSAIAGIACGLPVIAYSGTETAPPITEAGILLVSPGNNAELGEALLRVMSDAPFRESLAERSRQAQRNHFSWEAIAERYVEALRQQEKDSPA